MFSGGFFFLILVFDCRSLLGVPRGQGQVWGQALAAVTSCFPGSVPLSVPVAMTKRQLPLRARCLPCRFLGANPALFPFLGPHGHLVSSPSCSQCPALCLGSWPVSWSWWHTGNGPGGGGEVGTAVRMLWWPWPCSGLIPNPRHPLRGKYSPGGSRTL